MKVVPSRDTARVAVTVFGIIMMIHIYYTIDVLIELPSGQSALLPVFVLSSSQQQ